MTNDIKKIDGVDFILSFDDLQSYGITDTMISDDMKSIFENDNYKMLLINSTYEVASDELNNQTDEINKLIKKYDEKAILAGECRVRRPNEVVKENNDENTKQGEENE